MKRYILLLCFLTLTFLIPVELISQDHPLYSDFQEVRGEATGYIHIEKMDDISWFIDANGYAFFPVGMDHTKFFGNTVDLVSGGDAEACANHAFDILSDLKINACASLSYQPQKKAALERGFSYCGSVYPMVTPHSVTYKKEDYHRADPFSKEFESYVDSTINVSTARLKGDPHVLGMCYGFNPFQLMHKWINHFLAGDATTPAKESIVNEVYRKQYKTIDAFNRVYGKSFTSFDDILSDISLSYDKSLDPKPDEVVAEADLIKRDFNQITCLLIAKVHEVSHTYMRQYAPEMLILGYFFKPYNFNLAMYEAIAPYVDVLSPQHLQMPSYKNGVYNRAHGVLRVEKIHARTGKPIFISDMALGKVFKKGNKPMENNPYTSYNSQEDRGKVYYAAVEKAAALPSVVGLTGCMTIYDNPDEQGQHGANKGFIDPYTGLAKTEFTSYVKDINSQIYDIRMRENDIEKLTQNLIDAMHHAIH